MPGSLSRKREREPGIQPCDVFHPVQSPAPPLGVTHSTN